MQPRIFYVHRQNNERSPRKQKSLSQFCKASLHASVTLGLTLQGFSSNLTCVADDVPDCVPAFVMEVMQQCTVNYKFHLQGKSREILNLEALNFSV